MDGNSILSEIGLSQVESIQEAEDGKTREAATRDL